MVQIINYLRYGKSLDDTRESVKLWRIAIWFSIIEDTLYRRGFSLPFLRHVHDRKVKMRLTEVYEGKCGEHAGSQILAHKLLRQWYYWSTLHQDAWEIVTKCNACQRYANISHLSSVNLNTIISPWSFAFGGLT